MTRSPGRSDPWRAELARWNRTVAAVVAAKVADARAHGAAAVTEALRATPDGRATIRRAARSRSLQAGLARLDELWTDLAGPSVASREGRLRDARESFYRLGLEMWAQLLPEEARSGDGQAAALAIVAARAMVLHGQDLRTELAGPIATAKRSLQSAVALAGSQLASQRTSRDRLAGWELATRSALQRACSLCLGDDLVALDGKASRDLVRPDLLDDGVLDVDD